MKTTTMTISEKQIKDLARLHASTISTAHDLFEKFKNTIDSETSVDYFDAYSGAIAQRYGIEKAARIIGLLPQDLKDIANEGDHGND